MGRVIILGMVSATEEYCRAIIARLVDACPISRGNASTQSLAFGALDYYESRDLGFGLLEHVSFADGKTVRGQIQKILGIGIDDGSSAAEALKQFDLVCHLRHSAAHSSGNFAMRNVMGLGVSGLGRRVLRVDGTTLQITAKICLNAGRAINRLLYKKTIERWREGQLSGVWKKDKKNFIKLYECFYSQEDRYGPDRPLTAYNLIMKMPGGNRK